MEKGALPTVQRRRNVQFQPRRSSSFKASVAFTSLLVFLAIYNFIPRAHHGIQDFFTIEHWEEPVPQIKLQQGVFKGRIVDNRDHPVPIEAFLGIPYALPPVGERRFQKPVPVAESNRSFDATEYSSRCPGKQLLSIPGTPSLDSSEDCLTLNVFRIRHTFNVDVNAKLPVLVYIHGGAFNRGFAAMHDTASMLAWSEEPYLAISFNYRIGALGFLNSKLTAKEGLLNLGLHDQKLLLDWVQENAVALGGDPDDVTIAGLSAGAHSIGHHIMDKNEKRQFFHKAIMESGAPTSRVVRPADSKLHKAQFEKFVAQVGCASETESKILDCLRAAPLEKVTDAQASVFDEYNPPVRWAWQPVIDNDIISRRPLDAWKSGDYHKVPILTGFNHNEGTMYVPKQMDSSAQFTRFFATLLPQLPKAALNRLNKLYPDPTKTASSAYLDTRNPTALGIGSQYKRVEAAYGQYAYVCPVRQTAHLASVSPSAPPVWLYHWGVNKTMLGGANHGDQIWYETMSPAVRNVSPAHDDIAKSFNSYLTSFIVTGDPNGLQGRKAVRRPRWGNHGEAGETMVFGAGNDEAAGGRSMGDVARFGVDVWAREECEFWWERGLVGVD